MKTLGNVEAYDVNEGERERRQRALNQISTGIGLLSGISYCNRSRDLTVLGMGPWGCIN